MKLVAPVILFAAVIAAQQPRPVVDLVAARLSQPDAAAADSAMVDMIRGGAPNVPVLRAVLAVTTDVACRARAERALALCAIDAPVEGGLKVGLAADRKEVAPGSTVTFTATVGNVTAAPVALFLGMSYSGNVLENGLALQQLPGTDQAAGQGRLGAVGFCGTGAQPIVEVVAPWSTRTFVVTMVYRVDSAPRAVIQHQGPHLAAQFSYVPLSLVADADVARIRVRWDVDPKQAVGMAAAKTKPDWQGTLVSNAIELRLLGAR